MCTAMSVNDSGTQTEDEPSTGDTDQQRSKVKKKTRRKRSGQSAKVQETGNVEEHSVEEEESTGEGNTDEDEERNGLQVKPTVELSTAGGEFIYVVADGHGLVTQLWCSDEDWCIELEDYQLPTNLVNLYMMQQYKNRNNSTRQGYNGYKCVFKFNCSVCLLYKGCKCSGLNSCTSTCCYYVSKEGHPVCSECYDPANTSQQLADMYYIDLRAAHKFPCRLSVGLPWMANYLLKDGYKLVNCCTAVYPSAPNVNPSAFNFSPSTSYIYGFFVKQ